MEKRVLVAALISALFMAWYSSLIMKPGARPGPVGPALGPPAQVRQTVKQPTETIQYTQGEEVRYIESRELQVEIGLSGGAVRSATLKNFQDPEARMPLKVGRRAPLFSIVTADDTERSLRLVRAEGRELVLESPGKTAASAYQISYSFGNCENCVKVEFVSQSPDQAVTLTSAWEKADHLPQSQNALEAFVELTSQRGKPVHKHYAAPVRSEIIVPRGTMLFALAERHFCQVVKPNGGLLNVAILPSKEGIVALRSSGTVSTSADGSHRFSAIVYIGPRDYFYLKSAGVDSAFPIGTIGQIGLTLLVALKAIAGLTRNYGVAIIVFSALITLLLSPLTLLSVKSMKAMQRLKPMIDKITAQHKQDQTKANREIFALYKEHKVSPLSGCLPMLLQMPIFIALFQAMSHFIELRGKSFLWVRDLSLPDRAAVLPFSLPLIGRDLNLLPIIMAAVMYLQTKWSQQASGGGDSTQAAAKIMSGPLMSIIFCFMFYSFPSGLVLYWLTNSLGALVCYGLIR